MNLFCLLPRSLNATPFVFVTTKDDLLMGHDGIYFWFLLWFGKFAYLFRSVLFRFSYYPYLLVRHFIFGGLFSVPGPILIRGLV